MCRRWSRTRRCRVRPFTLPPGRSARRGTTRREEVKYMLLIYDNPDTRQIFFQESGAGMIAEMGALLKELTDSGELIATAGLADPSQTKTVRVQGGLPLVTDGPLAEAK